jgi:glycerol kinase
MPDVSVLGAAYLAVLGAGIFKNLEEVQQLFGQNRH